MNRKCGTCTLCCRLLPVRELDKGANQRCQHQRHTGCSVYHRPPAFPRSCGVWSCRWLTDDNAQELRRPDRVGYVIDQLPDLVKMRNKQTGEEERELMVLQVWVDPARRDAWQEPGLLRYAEKMARDHGMGMLLRYSTREAVFVAAPPLSSDGQWHVVGDGTIAESVSGSILLDRLAGVDRSESP